MIETLSGYLSAAVGCPTDQAKVLIWIMIHIPLGYLYRMVHGPVARLVYGMLVGTLFSWSMYQMRKSA